MNTVAVQPLMVAIEVRYTRSLGRLPFEAAFSGPRSIADFGRPERRVISNRWARWTLCKRQQSCGERGYGFIGLRLLVDRELKVGKTREAFVRAEDPQAGDDRAGSGGRRDGAPHRAGPPRRAVHRPGARPRTRAPHGRVRALADHPRSNSAKEPSICISMRDRFELTSEAIRSRSPECENGTRPILYPVEQHAKRYHINWVPNQPYLGNERFYTRT